MTAKMADCISRVRKRLMGQLSREDFDTLKATEELLRPSRGAVNIYIKTVGTDTSTLTVGPISEEAKQLVLDFAQRWRALPKESQS